MSWSWSKMFCEFWLVHWKMFLNMICPGTCSNYQKSMKMLTMMMLLPKDALMTVGANVEALISVQTSFCQLSPAGWWWAVVPLCNYIFPLSCFTLSLLSHLPLFVHSYCYFSIQASQTKLKNTSHAGLSQWPHAPHSARADPRCWEGGGSWRQLRAATDRLAQVENP